LGKAPKNNYYNEVILNDPTLTVDNPVAGHEIVVIVGSPSKVSKACPPEKIRSHDFGKSLKGFVA
jgi:hypothetical protein